MRIRYTLECLLHWCGRHDDESLGACENTGLKIYRFDGYFTERKRQTIGGKRKFFESGARTEFNNYAQLRLHRSPYYY